MEDYITVSELKEMFHIGNDKAYKLCELHDFPAFRFGEGQWLIDKSRLQEWTDKVIKSKTKSVSFNMALSPSNSDYTAEELKTIIECLTPDYD